MLYNEQMIVTNRQELAISSIRRDAIDIIEAGINAVLPRNIIKNKIEYISSRATLKINRKHLYSLENGRIFVIGGGKAAGSMAESLEHILLPGMITAGIVNCKAGNYSTSSIEINPAGHPVPDQRGVEGIEKMLDLKDKYSIGASDTIICLISGGASALMPLPAGKIDLEDLKCTNHVLINSGASIGEINIVRKHISRIKGGQLADYFAPARVISLIISDVVGNDISIIASGVTSPDPSTFQHAVDVISKHELAETLPRSVMEHLNRGMEGNEQETPKKLTNCYNHIIASNRDALESMQQRAREKGYRPLIISDSQTGDVVMTAKNRALEIMEGRYSSYTAIIMGGEVTVKLPSGAGEGGRNQQYAAVTLQSLKDYPQKWLMVSVGTDGNDYIPQVAGALVDSATSKKLTVCNMETEDYIDRYNAYNLFKKLGSSLVITGDTGTNVADIILYMFDN